MGKKLIKKVQFKVELSLREATEIIKQVSKVCLDEEKHDISELFSDVYFEHIVTTKDLELMIEHKTEPSGVDVLNAVLYILENQKIGF